LRTCAVSELQIVQAFNAGFTGRMAELRDWLVALRDGDQVSEEMTEFLRELMVSIHPDVVLDMRELDQIHVIYPARIARGLREWTEFWTAWLEPWDEFRWDGEWELIGPGVVLQDVTIEMSGRTSGVATSMHQWHRWEVFEGTVRRLSAHPTREAALAGPEAMSR
jgi:hypothetical protein